MTTLYPNLHTAIQALHLQGFLLVADLPERIKIERRKGRRLMHRASAHVSAGSTP